MSDVIFQLSMLGTALVLFGLVMWLLFRGSILLKISLFWICNLFLVICNTVLSLDSNGAYPFFGAMVVSSFITILFLVVFSRTVKKPLQDLVDKVNMLSKGDFSHKAIEQQINRYNEVGKLNKGLEELRSSFSDTLATFVKNAVAIQQATATLNTNSRNLSASVNDNASSLEEISSSMEEMVSNIAANVENTQKTESLAKKANKSVAAGNQSALEALSLMNEIAEKIKIVNEISFETNVLALNASVEASRAGEHGRGFSVVASEIRRLAEHSKHASNQIKEMTARGSIMSGGAMEQLNQSLPLMEQTSTNIQEINVASMEQNSGADQINNAVQSMNKVTQHNAVTADEMLQNTEVILKTSIALLNHIKQFKY